MNVDYLLIILVYHFLVVMNSVYVAETKMITDKPSLSKCSFNDHVIIRVLLQHADKLGLSSR